MYAIVVIVNKTRKEVCPTLDNYGQVVLLGVIFFK
jgi:hypothetical protein